MLGIRRGIVVTSVLVSMLLCGCGNASTSSKSEGNNTLESNSFADIESEKAVEDIAINYVYYGSYSPYAVLYNDGTFACQADDIHTVMQEVADVRALPVSSTKPCERLAEYFICILGDSEYETEKGETRILVDLIDKGNVSCINVANYKLLKRESKMQFLQDLYSVMHKVCNVDDYISSKDTTKWFNAVLQIDEPLTSYMRQLDYFGDSDFKQAETYTTPTYKVTFSKDKVEEYYACVLSCNLQEFKPTHPNEDGIMVTEYPDKYVVIRYRDTDGDADNDIVYYQLSDEDYESIIAKSVEYRQIAEKNSK